MPVTVNVFDQASRFAVQADPIGFFRWLAPGLDPALHFEGWLDTRTLPFPGDPDRVCDIDVARGIGGVEYARVDDCQRVEGGGEDGREARG